jgi:serine/threonine protein kinase
VAFQLRSSSDPFKAAGGRLKAPEALFNRQLRRGNLTAIAAIGAGQFGQVFTATEAVAKGGQTIVRAVKMLRGGASTSDRDEFVREAEVMLKMDHPNLVELIGVCVQQAPWLMVRCTLSSTMNSVLNHEPCPQP